MHESEITKASNKIIQGDWNWPYDHEDAGHAKQDTLCFMPTATPLSLFSLQPTKC